MSLSSTQRARAASAYRVRPLPLLPSPSSLTSPLRSQAILRSARLTFGADLPTLYAFKAQTRLLFHRFLPPAADARGTELPPGTERIPIEGLEKELDGVFEAARYLRSNVVQGVHRRDGTTSSVDSASTSQAGSSAGGERIALRIHRDTELGDNESIKRSSPFSSGNIDATVSCGGAASGPVLSDAAKERREKRRARRESLNSASAAGEANAAGRSLDDGRAA